jgi:hypothetical protein
MTTKDSRYWKAHKTVLFNEMDKLEKNDLNFILNNPQSQSAQKFEQHVERRVVSILKSDLQPA